MKNFFSNIISGIGINDFIDILVVAFVVYKILGFIRQSRAEQLVKGLLVILGATALSDLLHLYTLNWLVKSSLAVGVIALVVVFQPELRRGLESLGRSNILKTKFSQLDKNKAEDLANKFVDSVDGLSNSRTGALIIIERETALTDICETGTKIDAEISEELIGNIFYEGAPLHDGAVIIRGERMHSAGCVLPLTQNSNLPSSLGTRHRAGIGITEHSDAISIIVSEETGIISVAKDGKLNRFLDKDGLRKILLDGYFNNEDDIVKGIRGVVKKIGGSKNAPK